MFALRRKGCARLGSASRSARGGLPPPAPLPREGAAARRSGTACNKCLSLKRGGAAAEAPRSCSKGGLIPARGPPPPSDSRQVFVSPPPNRTSAKNLHGSERATSSSRYEKNTPVFGPRRVGWKEKGGLCSLSSPWLGTAKPSSCAKFVPLGGGLGVLPGSCPV